MSFGTVENAARFRQTSKEAQNASYFNRYNRNNRNLRQIIRNYPSNNKSKVEGEYYHKMIMNIKKYLRTNTTNIRNTEAQIRNLKNKLQRLRSDNHQKRMAYQSLVRAVAEMAGVQLGKLTDAQKKQLVNVVLYHYKQNPNYNQRRHMLTNLRNAIHRKVRLMFTRNEFDKNMRRNDTNHYPQYIPTVSF